MKRLILALGFLASPMQSETVDITQETAEQIDKACKLGTIRPVDVTIDGVPKRFFMGVKKDKVDGELIEFCEIRLNDKRWRL